MNTQREPLKGGGLERSVALSVGEGGVSRILSSPFADRRCRRPGKSLVARQGEAAMRNRQRVATALLGLAGSFVGSWVVADDPSTGASQPGLVHTANAAAAAATVSNGIRGPSLPSLRDLVDVTAMSTAFVAVDQLGRVVRDLRADEVTVFEDGSQSRLLSLDQRHSEAGPEASTEDPEHATGQFGDQRVVLYVSAELGDRALFRAVSQQIEEESTRLTNLGPVDVVVAHPVPITVTARERRPDEVRDALQRAVTNASGGTSVAGIRKNFARDFKPGAGFEQGLRPGGPSAGSVVVRTRDAMNRERALIHDALEQMVIWLQNQPPEAGGILIWITRGFDLNPADFYVPMVEQIDPFVARTLRSDSDSYRLDHELRWVVETALSMGWTVMPVTCRGGGFLFGAEIDGGRGVDAIAMQSSVSLASHGAEFAQMNPGRSLKIVAEGTGGHVAANHHDLQVAVEHLHGAYVVQYQVDRPLDGRLHELEIRCSRPGIKICCGRHRTASGTLRGVAVGRAMQLLAGEPVAGTRTVSASVVNIARGGHGKRIGDLVLTADLGELKTALSPLALGQMRVTVVVEMANGAPFVFHEEVNLDWRQVEQVWKYTARLDWPKTARSLAVVAEELVSATWGATTIPLG